MSVSVREIPVHEIIVGPRVRHDVGDVEELAASIRRYGLFHPVVVDGDKHLVAGARRLAAIQGVLGWDVIPVREYGELSELERMEIELEENSRRLDLSPADRTNAEARRFELIEARLAAERRSLEEAAAQAQAEEARLAADGTSQDGETPPIDAEGNFAPDARNQAVATPPKRKAGRPAKAESGVPEQQIADEAGVDRRTVQRVREHKAVLDRYGATVSHLSQEEGIAVGAALDKLDAKVRKDVLKRVGSPLPEHRAVAEIQKALREIAREEHDRDQAARAAQHSEEMERADTRRAWLRVSRALENIWDTEPEAVAAVLDDDERNSVATQADTAITWLARLSRAARPELREVEAEPVAEPATERETAAV